MTRLFASPARAKFRRALPAVVLLAVFLPGCPIYGDDEDGCTSDWQCANGYTCDERSGFCVRADRCDEPDDCARNETCSRSGRCVVGDCTFGSIGCVAGYVCGKPRGRWECVSEDDLGGAGTSGAGGSSAGESGAEAGAASGGDSAAGGNSAG